MLEGTLALCVVCYRLAASAQFVFISEQPFQSYTTPSVQLAVADAEFSARVEAL
jgi:hypothetical protein